MFASIRKYTLLSTVVLLTALIGCRKDPVITTDGQVTAEAGFRIPQGWPAPHYSFAENPLKSTVIQLGKRLFNDPTLSRDSTISCGSCHQPAAAFSQADHVLSHGVAGRLGVRNTPGLFNMAWHPSLMWDGGANNLETQILAPLQNHVEMDLMAQEALDRIAATPDYRQAFRTVYGTDEITLSRTLKAIAQFMAILISDDSKWDQVQSGKAQFTQTEAAGEQVFQQRCATCHQPPLFTDFSFRNNGLMPGATNDSGRMLITREQNDQYRFKVPSLRNLSFTPPYFHDGRAPTLDAVLQHYSTAVQSQHSANTDPILQGGVPLSGSDKANLKAFLITLNDSSFATNPRFR
ncbi:MAG: cytochrome-c peroxidase [Sphingobacteriales bacterium]|nr:MAG: cytochrome-c peroxidase [Sphingobacteriales bacterium]